MKYYLTLTEDAQLEETDAYNYYEELRQGLGEDLLIELEKSYNTIIENPFYFGYLPDDRRAYRAVGGNPVSLSGDGQFLLVLVLSVVYRLGSFFWDSRHCLPDGIAAACQRRKASSDGFFYRVPCDDLRDVQA